MSNLRSSKGRKYQFRSMNITERHCPRQGVVGLRARWRLMLTLVNAGRDPWHVLVLMEISTQTLTLALFAGINAAGAIDNLQRDDKGLRNRRKA